MRLATYVVVFLLLSTSASTSIAQHLTSAKLYLQQRQYDKAEASALKAVEKDPDDEEAWFVLGRASYEVKKYAEMVKAFEKAAALDSEEYKTEIDQYRLKVWADSYNDGIKFYNRGRDTVSYFQSAIGAFQTAITARPESLQTYYVCALAYYGNKQIDEAIQVLEVSLKRNPNAMQEIELLGKLHLYLANEKADAHDTAGTKREYDAALISFEKLHELDRANTNNIMRLIELYEQLGMGEKALALTRKGMLDNPDNRNFRFAYAVSLLKEDKYEESAAEFKKILEVPTGTVDEITRGATYNIGVAYLNWGVALKAEADRKAEASSKGQKGGKGAKEVKEDLSYKEKFKEALPYLEKAVEHAGGDINLWQQLGRLYANLNMAEKMKRAFAVVDSLMKLN